MRRIHCLLLAALVMANAASVHAQEKKVFRAGAYAQDITPAKFPISVNGGMQDRQATAAHDRLHAPPRSRSSSAIAA